MARVTISGKSQPAENFQQPLIQGLACATIQPSLRSVLIFDSSPPILQTAAELWVKMLSVTTQTEVKSVYLGSADTEESLWGSLTLSHTYKNQPFDWQSGLLGNNSALRVIVIPDLSRISLPAARACISLIGSEVAHLERHGHQACWKSNLCWLAGCSREQVKFLSPHLLDRFALRLSGQNSQACDHTTALRNWFSTSNNFTQTVELSNKLLQRLQSAHRKEAHISKEALDRGMAYLAKSNNQGFRRELALLRLAQARARFSELSETTAQHVDLAAGLIGLEKPSELLYEQTLNTRSQILSRDDTSEGNNTLARENKEKTTETNRLQPVYPSDSTIELPSEFIKIHESKQDPYPEDSVSTEREAASLRFPPRHFYQSTPGRGPIIGIEPATMPYDIAWVSTLLESAKYQAVRSKTNSSKSPLILHSTDLRRYRRAIEPEQLLTLVLDYTCLKNCQWKEVLLSYLQWAYIERASICLIQVGIARISKELQAKKITAQSVLVPRVQAGLNESAGLATPLAHGLDLALQTLRHDLQHGRSTVRQVMLVILSDGRGNVPLENSRKNEKPNQLVNRRGIEDALSVAEQIRQLKQVEAVVLNPQPKYCKDLPIRLAQALGAKIENIPSLKSWEVNEP
ncbi:MAG: hypothetical protein ACFB2W_27490 [Leptolyngbyaceae cyanobacterium]